MLSCLLSFFVVDLNELGYLPFWGSAMSVQGLNEFANVAWRKVGMTWPEIGGALADLRMLCSPILPMDIRVHEDTLRLAERHAFAFFDALMIANAVQAGCSTFFSEDMQDGMEIDGTLRIKDPFRDR